MVDDCFLLNEAPLEVVIAYSQLVQTSAYRQRVEGSNPAHNFSSIGFREMDQIYKYTSGQVKPKDETK